MVLHLEGLVNQKLQILANNVDNALRQLSNNDKTLADMANTNSVHTHAILQALNHQEIDMAPYIEQEVERRQKAHQDAIEAAKGQEQEKNVAHQEAIESAKQYLRAKAEEKIAANDCAPEVLEYSEPEEESVEDEVTKSKSVDYSESSESAL